MRVIGLVEIGEEGSDERDNPFPIIALWSISTAFSCDNDKIGRVEQGRGN
jgi:hypothetical protein